MSFVPQLVDTHWLCPCTDAYGQAAILVPLHGWLNDSAEVANFRCDQNGDRWQQMTASDGSVTWQYLGRPVESA